MLLHVLEYLLLSKTYLSNTVSPAILIGHVKDITPHRDSAPNAEPVKGVRLGLCRLRVIEKSGSDRDNISIFDHEKILGPQPDLVCGFRA